jgi:hypothetical protein
MTITQMWMAKQRDRESRLWRLSRPGIGSSTSEGEEAQEEGQENAGQREQTALIIINLQVLAYSQTGADGMSIFNN